jgi:hypothetical protein
MTIAGLKMEHAKWCSRCSGSIDRGPTPHSPTDCPRSQALASSFGLGRRDREVALPLTLANNSMAEEILKQMAM